MRHLPTVSVVMASYNHARYVTDAIDSVLSQAGVDFEFLIEDDGSCDNSLDIIKSKLKDPRIRFFPKLKNEGACTTVNHLINHAQGRFIALINSDDVWLDQNKLISQVNFLEENVSFGATFGRAAYIDEFGKTIEKDSIPYGHIFDEPNHTKSEWLRRFFLWGNCICHPTMLIRKACYEDVGLYDNRFRQVPDFEMWTRLIKKWDIHISDKNYISFRHIEGENTSASTPKNSTRLLNEYYFVFNKIFDDVTASQFSESFSDILTYSELPSIEHFEIEKSLIFLQPGLWLEHMFHFIGLQKIFNLLSQDIYRNILWEDYGIDDKWLQTQMSHATTFGNFAVPMSSSEAPSGTGTGKKPFSRLLNFLRR